MPQCKQLNCISNPSPCTSFLYQYAAARLLCSARGSVKNILDDVTTRMTRHSSLSLTTVYHKSSRREPWIQWTAVPLWSYLSH